MGWEGRDRGRDRQTGGRGEERERMRQREKKGDKSACFQKKKVPDKIIVLPICENCRHPIWPVRGDVGLRITCLRNKSL